MDFLEKLRNPWKRLLNNFCLIQKMSFARKRSFQDTKITIPDYWGLQKKNCSPPPPKWTSNFFMHESCWKIKSCPWCVQILFLFTRRVVNSPKCSGFKPFLNRIFIRGDTFIFMKKSDKIYLKKWGVVMHLKSTW